MVSRFSPAGPAVKNIAGCVNRRKCHLTEPEAGPATSQSIGVQSIEVGLLLLRPLLDAGSPLTLKAIAGAVSFAPPKAHRYLVSLIRSGLVERHRSSGHYQLGPLAVELGFAAIGRLDRDGWGREAVDELALETGVTSCSVAWVNGTAVVTAVELGMDTIFAGVRLGTRLPLLSSASGLVLLSYLPSEATARTVTAELAELEIERVEVERIIARTRANVVATIKDTVSPGISGVSAPVFDHKGSLICALTILGPTNKFNFSAKGDLARLLCRKAADLSARFGKRG
jgi:DNA-binding IclR family transcriptional regulator